MPAHPTVTLEHEGDAVEVDREIAPLIELLWANEVRTCQCCQGPWGEQGFAYITFGSAYDAARFLDLLGVEEDDNSDSLYMRIGNGYRSDIFPPEWRRWRWESEPYPHDWNGCWNFEVWAHFPSSDIPLLVSMMGTAEDRERERDDARRRDAGGRETRQREKSIARHARKRR